MLSWETTLKRELGELADLERELAGSPAVAAPPKWFLVIETMVRTSRLQELASAIRSLDRPKWAQKGEAAVIRAELAVQRARRFDHSLDEGVRTHLPVWFRHALDRAKALGDPATRVMQTYWMMEQAAALDPMVASFGSRSLPDVQWDHDDLNNIDDRHRDRIAVLVRNYRSARLMISTLRETVSSRRLSALTRQLDRALGRPTAEFDADVSRLGSADLVGTVTGAVEAIHQVLAEVRYDTLAELVASGWRRPIGGGVSVLGEERRAFVELAMARPKASSTVFKKTLEAINASVTSSSAPGAVILFLESWNEEVFRAVSRSVWGGARDRGTRFFVFLVGSSLQQPAYLKLGV